MEEHRIKSAWEIAMEKISKIPDLTPEELLKQEENEYKPVGEAITKRYLAGTLKSSELPLELNKHSKVEGKIVKRFFISSMLKSIELIDATKSLRVMSGLEVFGSNPGRFDELRKELEEHLKRFEKETSSKREIYEIIAKQNLQNLGITGLAVKPNLAENNQWKEELNLIRRPYIEKLDKIKNELRQLTGIE